MIQHEGNAGGKPGPTTVPFSFQLMTRYGITQLLGPENANMKQHETKARQFMGYTHCFTVTSDSNQCPKLAI
jgi:hypothetical protein